MASLRLWAPDSALDGVEIRVSTREGGVSQPPYDSLNLADHVGDQAESVAENRRLLGKVLPGDTVCWLNQVHGVRTVEAREGVVPEADAHWTDARNRPLVVLTADCLPVVIAAGDATCVGIAHAGWRGLAAGVLESLLTAMPAEPASMTAWLGPAISAAAYEVGPEVKTTFEQQCGEAGGECFQPSHRHGHWMADLTALARLRLSRAGVSTIAGGDRCTYGEPEHYFSHRREGPATGRMATLVWLS
jgi:YfiH family protein